MNYKTKQRELIIKVLKDNMNYSMSAKQISLSLSSQVSKATLYRTLDLLVEDNKIKKVYNELNSSYEYQYVDNDNCSHHFHLKCIKCGRLIHLDCNSCDEFMTHLLKSHKFMPKEGLTVIYGICNDCSLIRRKTLC
ncbi:MAG: transcriptional repressor [Bacillales bacterium]|nr:transcriptional repressor [Bacillales bacterium]